MKEAPHYGSSSVFSAYLGLTKPRLVSLALASTAVGYVLASEGSLDWYRLVKVLAGTWLVASGSMTLNQWMEKDRDKCMRRTRARPIPSGRILPAQAFFFGVLLSGAGLAFLWWHVNALSCLLAGITLVLYVLVYTPLKQKTPFSTLTGCLPGAIPPLIGWAGAAEELSAGAWVIFSIVFLWQMPHFFSIGWVCREDYAAARFPMVFVKHPDEQRIGREIVFYLTALFVVSLLPVPLGISGPFYGWGAAMLGIIFLSLSLKRFPSFDRKARLLFRFSVVYLFLLFFLMVVDRP